MATSLKKRSEIEDKYKWQISHLYLSDEAWRKEYDQLIKNLPAFSKYKGSLADSGESLYKCLAKKDELSQKAELLYAYAGLRLREDNTNPTYQALSDSASTMIIELSSITSFVEPEILTIHESVLNDFITNYEPLQVYQHYIKNLTRLKAHILSPELEQLLAKVSDIGQTPSKIFAMLNDADMKFGTITDSTGEKIELTHGNFISMLESEDAEIRKAAFSTYYSSYIAQKNTLAALYAGSVKKDIFFAKERKFKTSMESALADTNIPVSVYKNLIKTVEKHLSSLHKYVDMRKKALNLKEIHMYDLYAPMVKDIDITIEYDKAVQTVTQSLAPLGCDYVTSLINGFGGGWIDVYENIGKDSGAFSWGPYGSHPYVLLNFSDNIKSMFTLAHEMGHAMHSYYTAKHQPYVYGGHTLFAAEVASTVNEALLMEHLLATTTNEQMLKYLTNYYMEQFRGTLFRQTMFAEFELTTHEMAEADEPLTTASLNALYHKLNLKYYGPNIIIDEEIDYEWSRIPHFYRPYYVYQYATGYSAAIALSKLILKGGESVNHYLAFLKSGSSDYSINLLKGAGVDMSKAKPIESALKVFDSLVDQFHSYLS